MKETNIVRAQPREAFESIHRFFFFFSSKEIQLELHFEGKCFYCDLTVKAVPISRSQEALQHIGMGYRSFMCMLYIRTIDGRNLKFNPVSSLL
jgi:hypothetical protein